MLKQTFSPIRRTRENLTAYNILVDLYFHKMDPKREAIFEIYKNELLRNPIGCFGKIKYLKYYKTM